MLTAVSHNSLKTGRHPLTFCVQITSLMGGSKQAPTHGERRGHHKSLSVDATTSVSRQQDRKRMKNDLEVKSNSLDFGEVIDNINEGHEEQMKQQQAILEDLQQDHHKARKDNARLREQRTEILKERVKEQEEHDELKKAYTYLQKHYDDIAKQKVKLEHKHDYVDQRYNYLVGKVMVPYAQTTGRTWDDQAGATIDVVIDPLFVDALEASSLREQVCTLQKEMFARVDKGDPVSDEQLAQDFRNLAAVIKSLSRTIRFTEEVDVIKVLGTPPMLEKVATHHWDGRARKKCMIEAWIWSGLMIFVFDTPFSILGTASKALKQAWTDMFGSCHAHDWPAPSFQCETWRCTTTEFAFKKMATEATIMQGKTSEASSVPEKSVLEARDNVAELLENHLTQISPTFNRKLVRQIVDKAFTLAMQLSFQRSRLQITFPVVGASFDKESMKSMPSEDNNDIAHGVVAFIANPGLTKWGDAHGKNLDYRYDIVPALVQLEAAPVEKPLVPLVPLEKLWADVAKHQV